MKRISMLLMLAVLAFALVPAVQAQGFLLVAPTGATLIREKSTELATFTWTPLTGAIDYDLTLFKVSTNPRDTALGQVFTVNVPTSNCTVTVCTHTTTGPQLALIDTGQFAWTVVADTVGGGIEATNGALFFNHNPNDIALLPNGNFDTGSLSPWIAVNLTNDQVKAGIGVGGTVGFEFKGGVNEAAAIKQKLVVKYYNITIGDELFFSMTYKANSGVISGQGVAKVVYTPASGLTPDTITLTAFTNTNFTTTSTSVFPDGPVKKIIVSIKHQTISGKFTVDDVILELLAVP